MHSSGPSARALARLPLAAVQVQLVQLQHRARASHATTVRYAAQRHHGQGRRDGIWRDLWAELIFSVDFVTFVTNDSLTTILTIPANNFTADYRSKRPEKQRFSPLHFLFV